MWYLSHPPEGHPGVLSQIKPGFINLIWLGYYISGNGLPLTGDSKLVNATHTLVVSDRYLIELQAHSTGGKLCLVLETWTSEVMNLKRESTTTTLVDQHTSLLHSKSYHYTHRWVYLSPLINETSLYSKWRPLQKTTVGHSAEMNRL